MDISERMHLNIEAETINSAYLKLLDEFTSKDENYESRTAVISIKDVFNSELPCRVEEPFNKYYKVFINNDSLEKKWNLLADEWCLSYARRIMKKRNDIDLWTKAKKELLQNKDTRRCIIITYRDDDDLLDYLPSLLSIQFTIESNKMNMLTVWRSKELYTAFPINTLCMHSLMIKMFNEIKSQYTKLEIGMYSEIIGALHKLAGDKKPKQFGDNLKCMDLEKVKFFWSILETGKEKEYDKNY